jgi:hypothetical protein
MQTRGEIDAMASGRNMASPAERRSEREVRLHFEEACLLVAPFFEPAGQWSKLPLELLAMRALRERFAHLTSAELMVMLCGIRNLHDSRRTPVPSCSP